MRRPIWIAGAVGFVAALVAGVFGWQICVPCLALVLGAAAGYWGCQMARPETQNLAVRAGATGGAMSGLGALAGQVIGGIIGAARLGPAGAAGLRDDLLRSLGVTVPQTATNPAIYYGTAFGVAACLGLVAVILMAATGAMAGLIWYRQTHAPASRPALDR